VTTAFSAKKIFIVSKQERLEACNYVLQLVLVKLKSRVVIQQRLEGDTNKMNGKLAFLHRHLQLCCKHPTTLSSQLREN